MKKFIVLAAAVLLPLMTWAQAQIDTKKMKISDFTSKVTKVVLTGNPIHDAYMKKAVSSKWNVSPFEFCILSEYESLKSNDSYYFLPRFHCLYSSQISSVFPDRLIFPRSNQMTLLQIFFT